MAFHRRVAVCSLAVTGERKKIKLYTDTIENTKQTTQKTFTRQAPTQSQTATDGDNALKAKRSK